MSARWILLLAVLAAATLPVHARGGNRGRGAPAQQDPALDRARELINEMRKASATGPGGVPRRNEQIRVFREMAKLDHAYATRTLIDWAELPEFEPIRADQLRILAEGGGIEGAEVANVMRRHLGADDPYRGIARDYLVDRAVKERDDTFLGYLFDMKATAEDQFLALRALGDIESAGVLDRAWTLARDPSWEPAPGGLVNCGTIARAVRGAEGERAARLLLLLLKDGRFATADALAVRQATRMWRTTDLRDYVDFAALNDPDVSRRKETAMFLGIVGIEAARAPLLRLALNRDEPPEVRAAAAAALGGLRIARTDLAEKLEPLCSDPDPVVRLGAMEGLGRLAVRRAAEALVRLTHGPHAKQAKATLAHLTSLPAASDWDSWLAKLAEIPEGA